MRVIRLLPARYKMLDDEICYEFAADMRVRYDDMHKEEDIYAPRLYDTRYSHDELAHLRLRRGAARRNGGKRRGVAAPYAPAVLRVTRTRVSVLCYVAGVPIVLSRHMFNKLIATVVVTAYHCTAAGAASGCYTRAAI